MNGKTNLSGGLNLSQGMTFDLHLFKYFHLHSSSFIINFVMHKAILVPSQVCKEIC